MFRGLFRREKKKYIPLPQENFEKYDMDSEFEKLHNFIQETFKHLPETSEEELLEEVDNAEYV